MRKEEIILAAHHLRQPSLFAQQEYKFKSNLLVAKVNAIMSAREDLYQLIGQHNLDMMQDNHSNHARFMGSLFCNYHPKIFIETVVWVFCAYRSHGFHLTYWPAQLNTWVSVLEKELTQETYKEIYPFYDWMIVHIPAFVALSEEKYDDIASRGRSEQYVTHEKHI